MRSQAKRMFMVEKRHLPRFNPNLPSNEIGQYRLFRRTREGIGRKELNRAMKKRKIFLPEPTFVFVVSIAKKYVGNSADLTLLDLIQEGNLGLFGQLTRIDWTKGYKIATYATRWIRQAITRVQADQPRTIRVPVHYALKLWP